MGSATRAAWPCQDLLERHQLECELHQPTANEKAVHHSRDKCRVHHSIDVEPRSQGAHAFEFRLLDTTTTLK